MSIKIDHRVIEYHKEYFLFEEPERYGLKILMSSSDSFGPQMSQEEKISQLNDIYEFLGIEKSNVYAGYQVHGAEIADVGTAPSDDGLFFAHEFDKTDGLITTTVGTCLLTKFADCTPIVLLDDEKRVLASLHSGWRGTQQKILKKAIEKMKADHGTDPQDLIVFVGPSIKQQDFEVGEDLIELFEQSHGDISKYLISKENGRSLFDMTSLIEDDLLKEGVKESNIFVSTLSTYTDPKLHSYRRDGSRSGRMYLFAMMTRSSDKMST
ncbi:MAG: peptidoglycan editing factor PgeF [Peptostreptococcaceae bacterium]|nr:peptidoglycan editing factor PgeF [Peptostreptococcaceae bacterium]